MKTKKRSTTQIVDEQIKKWNLMRTEKKPQKGGLSVITVSREPGSNGQLVAEQLAASMDCDLFHQEVVHKMAEDANTSRLMVETLDEKGLNVLQEWTASLVDRKHLWPDQYLKHLMKVVGTIGKHGNAVIIGRGANFILPPDTTFSIRIIAPLDVRIDNIVQEEKVSEEDALRRIKRTEADRRAFVRKYFYSDISDPTNYDLTINMKNLNVDSAVKIIQSALII